LRNNTQIGLFLRSLRKAISDDCFVVIPRAKNNDFLAKHGFSPDERVEVIQALKPINYLSGPEKDRDRPQEIDIWKFNTKYQGLDIHVKIKLTLKADANGDHFYAKCLSFHD
jgi:hypothetical protein